MRFLGSESYTFIAVAVIALNGIPVNRGDTIVVPNTNTSNPGPGGGATTPFHPNARWQQVYGGGQFDSVSGDLIEINQIRFRIDENTQFSNFSTLAKGLSIFMASTTRTYSTASSVFTQNPESPLFEVLPLTDLPMSGSRTSATSFDVIIPLPNKYLYNRRAGNLLVEVRSVGGASLPFLDVEGTLPDATFSVAGTLNSPSGTKSEAGFITQFQFTVVPEPRTLVLLVIGCVGLFRRVRK